MHIKSEACMFFSQSLQNGIRVLLLLLFAQSIQAQSNEHYLKGGVVLGSISSGTATYTINSYAATIGMGVDLNISDGVAGDLMFQSGWLYRVLGDGAEIQFPQPDSAIFSASEALLIWNDVDARGLFSAQLLIQINQPVNASAVLTETMMLTNLVNGDLNIDVFNYQDIDANGSFGNDVAALVNANDYMQINDGSDHVEYRAGGANAFQVTPFASLRTQLTDASITNFNNSGLPMPSGDFTGGFQWTTQLMPVYGEYTLQVITSYNTAAPEPLGALVFVDFIFADDFE